MFRESSPVLAVIIGLVIAAAVVGIVWLIMMAIERYAAGAKVVASPPETLRRMIGMAGMAGSSKAADAPSSAGDGNGAAAEDIDEEELVAVMAAAIAAYSEECGSRGLTVRKIRRAAGYDTSWSLAARTEQMDSRRF